MAFLTRSVAVWLALGCVLGYAEIARAETSLRGARVVWVRGDRVYVASPDSVVLEPGTILTFKDRKKKVAAAEVTAVHDGELIAATMTSGSFKKVRHLEKLEVTAERPVLRAPSILRVGYPAAGRRNLLIDCPSLSLDSTILQGAYKSEVIGGEGYRLVRDLTYSVAAAWPDTLLVRLFDEVSDEEIALERGDLDAAVFWPGEASTHIREVMRWLGRPSGVRAGDMLAASAWVPGVAPDSAWLRAGERKALALLNQEMFRGDLAPWPFEGPMPPSAVSGRFEVDASSPGRESIERFLNHVMDSSTTRGGARVVRLFRVDTTYEDYHLLGGPPFTYVFSIRCPVISAPRLQSYLNSAGMDPLVNLFACESGGQRR